MRHIAAPTVGVLAIALSGCLDLGYVSGDVVLRMGPLPEPQPGDTLDTIDRVLVTFTPSDATQDAITADLPSTGGPFHLGVPPGTYVVTFDADHYQFGLPGDLIFVDESLGEVRTQPFVIDDDADIDIGEVDLPWQPEY